MLQTSTIKFLKNLQKNNSKEWFDKNRADYETTKADFAELVTGLIQSMSAKDATIAALTYKDCIFRINRDVRFSKNKAPYKSYMGCYLVKGGKKSMLSGYYFHCEPGGKSFVGGGLYGAETAQLKKIRQEIDYNWEEFKGILTDKKFKKVFGDLLREEGMSLVREPKGYEKENPAIDYLKLKSWIGSMPLSDADLTDKALAKKIIEAFTALKPLVLVLNRALEE